MTREELESKIAEYRERIAAAAAAEDEYEVERLHEEKLQLIREHLGIRHDRRQPTQRTTGAIA